MSGTSLDKKGNNYICGQCEGKKLRPWMNYCPYCGKEIILYWDADNDCKLGSESDPKT